MRDMLWNHKDGASCVPFMPLSCFPLETC